MLSLLLLALPAGAAKLFTVDDGDQIQQFDGTDDVSFSFAGLDANGLPTTVSGEIRALQVFDPPVDRFDLFLEGATSGDVANCVDIGTDAGTCISATSLDPSQFDILIVDVVLFSGSIDQIGIGVSTDPSALNPSIAGWMDSCSGGLWEPDNCRDGSAGQAPTGVTLLNGGGFFPGAALFDFGTTLRPDAGNLNAPATTRRLFVAWLDTGAETPLSKFDQEVVFMLSSGINHSVSSNIVPEPSTVALLGLGLAGLAGVGGRRNRRA